MMVVNCDLSPHSARNVRVNACSIILNTSYHTDFFCGEVLPVSTIVISTKADIAPANTVSLGCLMAMIAAMKNVLSPISDTSITLRLATKAWMNPTFSFTTFPLVDPGLLICDTQ
ncbi:hypothetical protein NQ315_007495 [Exocentrus adspersus]|uniref:Uncharacterized protein n=1 Tax=Exocentrus adspersus TaxID=1586481 RepID=A0AAV8W858_9CUCU|nr:hypothetical protein NQ315_007495 [Exocentrus adspersus]